MKEKIIKLRNEGKTYNEIKEILKCSKSTISYHCSKIESNTEKIKLNKSIADVNKIKDRFLLLDDEKINEVIELRKLKKTYKEISELLNVSLNVISNVCRKLKLQNERNYGKIDENIIEKISILYNELKSIKRVSEKLNISRKSVSKYLNIKRDKLNSDEIKKHKVKNVIEWRIRVKKKLVEYKGGKCEKCGYDKCVDALEFHHKEPKEKDFKISGKSWSYERLKKESDKCILVCSNCHKEIHSENR